ncbi:hypothetical protein SCANM124S_03586 [Streptomyces canus]
MAGPVGRRGRRIGLAASPSRGTPEVPRFSWRRSDGGWGGGRRGQSRRPVAEASHGGPSRRPVTEARHGGPSQRPVAEAGHGGPSQRPVAEAGHGGRSRRPVAEARRGGPSRRPVAEAGHSGPSRRQVPGARRGGRSRRPVAEAGHSGPSRRPVPGARRGGRSRRPVAGVRQVVRQPERTVGRPQRSRREPAAAEVSQDPGGRREACRRLGQGLRGAGPREPRGEAAPAANPSSARTICGLSSRQGGRPAGPGHLAEAADRIAGNEACGEVQAHACEDREQAVQAGADAGGPIRFREVVEGLDVQDRVESQAGREGADGLASPAEAPSASQTWPTGRRQPDARVQPPRSAAHHRARTGQGVPTARAVAQPRHDTVDRLLTCSHGLPSGTRTLQPKRVP